MSDYTDVPQQRRMPESHQSHCDVVVIGAGFAGLYMLKRLRDEGFSVHVYESGNGVGGTWYWNRYPGARCDVESLYYSYSFSEELQQEWEWTERYPGQPELLRYLEHVADRFGLYRDITFGTTVERADWDAAAHRWTVQLGSGERVRARFLVSAVGCLSAARTPHFPGMESFTGGMFHTAQWPHEGADFTGQRVAVIGTGSSGIQSIPELAAQAAHVTVFQRTANFSVPARNRPLDAAEQQRVKGEYAQLRAAARVSHGGFVTERTDQTALGLSPQERRAELDRRWAEGGLGFLSAFADTILSEEANEVSAEYVRERIRETVRDPETAELLCPDDHPVGGKRICVDTGYFATYNRDNVSLVSVRDTPIEEFTPRGIRTTVGEHPVDAVVFATGFDAMTGALNRIDMHGEGGRRLADKWAAGPRTYLGLATAGFPNLFLITGPGSPSVLSNMPVSIEQHVEWIADQLCHLRERGLTRTEAEPEAEDAWVEHVNELAAETLYPQANSWYLGANVPGKPRVFMPYIGGVGTYRDRCAKVAEAGYQGFTLR